MDLPNDVELSSPVEFTGKVSLNSRKEIQLEGHISAKVFLVCVRCLEKFVESVEIELDETYFPKERIRVFLGKELGFSDLNRFAFERNIFNTDEIIQDTVIASIPLYPMCLKCRQENS